MPDASTHRISHVRLLNYGKILAIFVILYLFLTSIGLIGGAFKGLGKDLAASLLQSAAGPVIGLFVGLLSTSLIQSSSTTTSLVVGMVSAGSFGADPHLAVVNAVPIIMGANIGTSITNTVVSMGHIVHRAEFERAFSASIIHDFFNVMAVLVLLPLEIYFGLISTSANQLATIFIGSDTFTFHSPVKAATAPAVEFFQSMFHRQTLFNADLLIILFALALLFFSLRSLTKLIRSLVIQRLEAFFDTHIFKTAVRALGFGIFITILVQSSSITTSLVVPLAGAGILRLEQIFPYTLGSNIGTTCTALLASLVTGTHAPLAVAFSHLLFNILGILIIWGIPFIRQLPLEGARRFSKLAATNRVLPVVYVVVAFFLFPILLILILR